MKTKKIIRKFDILSERGAAAFLAGSKVEGLSLISMVRKGTKVIATYSKEK